MTAEQGVIDPAAILAEHGDGTHRCYEGVQWLAGFGLCLPYRLAALVLDLQGKVTRVELQARIYARNDRPDVAATFRRAIDDPAKWTRKHPDFELDPEVQ